MSGILWNEIVFGPIKSRRLGSSLGVNLLPGKLKICTFNCVYCECGWGKEIIDIAANVYTHNDIISTLETRLKELVKEQKSIDSITFAGNGEPTMYPEFSEIVNDVINLRDKYFPEAKTTCLSNSTIAFNPKVRAALLKLDNVMMKLDAGSQEMFNTINRPFQPISIEEIVTNLTEFNGKLIIQSLFLKGDLNGEIIDNASPKELDLWLGKIAVIKPKKVIIYPIDRETPASNLQKLSVEEMNYIASRVESLGIPCEVYS
jgi:wyosine [tRNA(Phe)-imidazoG37] synthetase (radical SAM superfamily)